MLEHLLSGIKRFKSTVGYYLLDETNKNLADKVEKFNQLVDHQLDDTIIDLEKDIEFSKMVNDDITDIIDGLPNKTIFDVNVKMPIVEVLQDNDTVRVYGLGSEGGFVLYFHKKYNHCQIHSLGEDDGYYFLESRHLYEPYQGSQTDSLHLLSKVLEAFKDVKI